jgi:hypothetical protein
MSFTPHRATFDEFGWRDGAGRVHFASQRQTPIAQAAPGPGLAGAQPLQAAPSPEVRPMVPASLVSVGHQNLLLDRQGGDA